MKAFGWIHGKLYQLILWLLMLVPRAVWNFTLAVLMLLAEEVRRWLGILMGGLMVYLAGKATLNYAPPSLKKQLAITVLAMAAAWSLVAIRAAKFTLSNNLLRVRQRMWFRQVIGEVKELRSGFVGMLARATESTPVGGMFRTNREKTEQRRQAAAEREAEKEQRRREVAEEPDPAIWEWI